MWVIPKKTAKLVYIYNELGGRGMKKQDIGTS